MGSLIDQLNRLVYRSLGLGRKERAVVHDLVHVRLALNDGKVGPVAVRPPTPAEMRAYADRLKSELDVFADEQTQAWHKVDVVHDPISGMVQVDLIDNRRSAAVPIVLPADHKMAAQFEETRQRLRQQRSQWVYFDRNLRIYEGTRTFILKPMQRFHWTVTQARVDAREIIAETLDGGDRP